MKKINLFTLIGIFLGTISSSTRADINNTDIYLVNKTNKSIAISQPLQEQIRGIEQRKTESKAVGQPVTVQPGGRAKIASLGRDQSIYNPWSKDRWKTTLITFKTDAVKSHTFESRSHLKSSGAIDTSTLKYNSHKLPYKEIGMNIHSYYVFPKLYHDVEIIFDNAIK